MAAAQLQQAFSAGSGGRRPGEGLLHVDHPLAQPPLKTIQLVKLLHLRSPERTVVTSASPHLDQGGITTQTLGHGSRPDWGKLLTAANVSKEGQERASKELPY